VTKEFLLGIINTLNPLVLPQLEESRLRKRQQKELDKQMKKRKFVVDRQLFLELAGDLF
jgi:hypothetical protein